MTLFYLLLLPLLEVADMFGRVVMAVMVMLVVVIVVVVVVCCLCGFSFVICRSSSLMVVVAPTVFLIVGGSGHIWTCHDGGLGIACGGFPSFLRVFVLVLVITSNLKK